MFFDELKVILIKTPIVQNATVRFLQYTENAGFAEMKRKKKKINKKQLSNAERLNRYAHCLNLWLKYYCKTSMYHSAGNTGI